MEVTSDFVGHVQSAVGLDIPVLNSGSTGFTTVTASSSPALGGTVSPSGSAHVTDGTRFVIQIQTGGAVGTATFKTSVDGGNTFGALQTSAASMTDATSGITLAFSGTFTSGGTATFRSAFTPLATWADAGGNIRGIIDHLGLRRGRVTEYYEDWLALGSATISGATTNTSGRVSWSVPALATLALSATSGYGYILTFNGSNVANATTTRVYSSGTFANFATTSSVVAELEINGALTGGDVKLGFSTTPSSAVATPSTAAYELAICRQSTDTNYQFLVNQAGSGAVTKIDTGVTAGSVPIRVTLEWHGSASAYGGPSARCFVNGTLVAITTTNVPTFGGAAAGLIAAMTTTNATNSSFFSIGPARVLSPRYATIDPI